MNENNELNIKDSLIFHTLMTGAVLSKKSGFTEKYFLDFAKCIWKTMEHMGEDDTYRYLMRTFTDEEKGK